VLLLDLANLAKLDRVKYSQQLGNETPEMLNAIGLGTQNHDAERAVGQALPELDAPVGREKSVEIGADLVQQFIVGLRGPAHLDCRRYLMTANVGRKIDGQEVVEENTHLRRSLAYSAAFLAASASAVLFAISSTAIA
jgi:hypothetical protein